MLLSARLFLSTLYSAVCLSIVALLLFLRCSPTHAPLTHAAQVPGKLDLIYIYFRDESCKETAMKMLGDTPSAGTLSC